MAIKRVTNSWWHRWKIKRAGRKDGKLGIPSGDQAEISSFESGLVELGHHHLEQIRNAFANKIQSKEGEFNAGVQRLERIVSSFASEFERYAAKKKELGRDVVVHFSRFWYLIILSLIALGELALNFQAFQVFQKPLLLTLIMAMAIALGLPVSAHFIGVFVKQWPHPAWKTALLTLLFAAIGILCLSGINIARSEYLKLMDVTLAAHDEVLHQAFLMINLFVFAVAILMSYFAHDSDPDFEKLYNEVRSTDRLCHQTSDRILHLAGQIDSLRIRHQAEERLLQSVIRELIYLYRGENQRVRADAKLPVAFQNVPRTPQLGDVEQTQILRPMSEVQDILERWSRIQRPSSGLSSGGTA